jgi:hypothetical protein
VQYLTESQVADLFEQLAQRRRTLHRRVKSVGQLNNQAKPANPITPIESIASHRIIHRRGHSTGHLELLFTQVTAPAQPVSQLEKGNPIPATLFNPIMKPDPAAVDGELVHDVGSPEDFPKLSHALLNTITAQRLRKVLPIFPCEPLTDEDVLQYYLNIFDQDEELENVVDDPEQLLIQLGLSHSRLLSLKDNLRALGELYTVDPACLWKLYDAKTMMVWIVAGTVYTSTSSTSGQTRGGYAGGESGRGTTGSQDGASKSATSGKDSTQPAGDRSGGQRRGGTGGGRRPRGGGRTGTTGRRTKQSSRDTVHLRFPKENEMFFEDGKAFLNSPPHYTPFDFEDVEFAEDATTIEDTSSERHDEPAGAVGGSKEAPDGTAVEFDYIEEDATTIEDTSSERHDEPAGAVGGSKEAPDGTAVEFDYIEEDDPMWCIKKNVVMRSVYHGLPEWEYSRLVQHGRWNIIFSRGRGELSASNAVYFSTSKNFALFFAAFKSAISTDCPLEKLSGIVIETPLPPCEHALVCQSFREEFAELNRNRDADAPIPPAPVVITGFLKHWVKEDANRPDLAEVVLWSHQLAVVDWENGPMKSLINLNPSYIAIIKPVAAVFEEKKGKGVAK